MLRIVSVHPFLNLSFLWNGERQKKNVNFNGLTLYSCTLYRIHKMAAVVADQSAQGYMNSLYTLQSEYNN